ncbi:unnamed protein product, partial [Mesorhabditis spiculigera]
MEPEWQSMIEASYMGWTTKGVEMAEVLSSVRIVGLYRTQVLWPKDCPGTLPFIRFRPDVSNINPSGGTSRQNREKIYEPWNNRALIWNGPKFSIPEALQIIGEMLENREGLLDGRMRTVTVFKRFSLRFPEDMNALPGPKPSPMERNSVAALHINAFFEKYIASEFESEIDTKFFRFQHHQTKDVLLMVREHGRYHPATVISPGGWGMNLVTMSLLCLQTHDSPDSIR